MKKKLSLILITSLFSLSLTANRYPLHDACTQGNLKAVQKLLVDYEQMPSVIKKIVNANDNYKRTPLHITAKKGHLPIVKYLVSMGAYVNAKDGYGYTPLHHAARYGHLKVVKYLLDVARDLTRKFIKKLDNELNKQQTNNMCDLLVGQYINAINKYNCTALHYAADNGHLEIVKLLIANDADVNAKDNTGYTPLHWAAMHGHLDIVKFLVEYCTKKGITLNMRNNKKLLPQDLALQVGHRNIYNYLINAQKQLILNRLGSMTNVFGV